MLAGRGFFGASFAERSDRILTERTQVMRLVGTHRYRERVAETNTALLEARQNEIMKTLTTITVLVLPLELIASVLVLDLPGTPLRHDPNAFLYCARDYACFHRINRNLLRPQALDF